MAIAVWLLTIVVFILPQIGNSARILFWSVVMIGLFTFGAASLSVLRFPSLSVAIRIGLVFMASTAILLGITALFENEVQSRRSGQGENVISLMAVVLAVHGALLLTYLVRQRFWTLSSGETRDF